MLNNNNVSEIRLPQASGVKIPMGFVFIFCFIYWTYLLFTSKMVIVHDATTFENLGKLLYGQGWIEFFKTGPHNEPVFPLLIAFSMRVADFFSISYQTVQTCLHIFILFSAQLLTLFILRQIRISQGIQALVILYIGISPALVNATFSLWSEVVTYPLILGIILISVKSWQLILSNKYKKVILWGAYLAFIFIIVTSIKALFEYIFIFFMAPFLLLMIKSIIKKERRIFIGTLLFFVITVFLFNAYLFFYKSLNQKHNGHFMLTDRGPYILYGNIAKRSEQLTLKRFLSCLAFVPGDRVCYKLFDKNDCDFWHTFTVEEYGQSKLKELKGRGVPHSEIDSMMVTLTKKKILERPFQQALLLFIESFKMLFWESTQVGFVSYSPWLQKIFLFTPFKNGLRLLLFLITFISIAVTLRYTLRSKDQLFRYQSPENIEAHIFFFILIFIMSYTGLYSLFIINTRYASPIASLYLIMIASTIQKTMFKQRLDRK